MLASAHGASGLNTSARHQLDQYIAGFEQTLRRSQHGLTPARRQVQRRASQHDSMPLNDTLNLSRIAPITPAASKRISASQNAIRGTDQCMSLQELDGGGMHRPAPAAAAPAVHQSSPNTLIDIERIKRQHISLTDRLYTDQSMNGMRQLHDLDRPSVGVSSTNAASMPAQNQLRPHTPPTPPMHKSAMKYTVSPMTPPTPLSQLLDTQSDQSSLSGSEVEASHRLRRRHHHRRKSQSHSASKRSSSKQRKPTSGSNTERDKLLKSLMDEFNDGMKMVDKAKPIQSQRSRHKPTTQRSHRSSSSQSSSSKKSAASSSSSAGNSTQQQTDRPSSHRSAADQAPSSHRSQRQIDRQASARTDQTSDSNHNMHSYHFESEPATHRSQLSVSRQLIDIPPVPLQQLAARVSQQPTARSTSEQQQLHSTTSDKRRSTRATESLHASYRPTTDSRQHSRQLSSDTVPQNITSLQQARPATPPPAAAVTDDLQHYLDHLKSISLVQSPAPQDSAQSARQSYDDHESQVSDVSVHSSVSQQPSQYTAMETHEPPAANEAVVEAAVTASLAHIDRLKLLLAGMDNSLIVPAAATQQSAAVHYIPITQEAAYAHSRRPSAHLPADQQGLHVQPSYGATHVRQPLSADWQAAAAIPLPPSTATTARTQRSVQQPSATLDPTLITDPSLADFARALAAY